MNPSSWTTHERRRLEREDREVAARATKFRSLSDDELREKLDRTSGATPWERKAARRVMSERGLCPDVPAS